LQQAETKLNTMRQARESVRKLAPDWAVGDAPDELRRVRAGYAERITEQTHKARYCRYEIESLDPAKLKAMPGTEVMAMRPRLNHIEAVRASGHDDRRPFSEEELSAIGAYLEGRRKAADAADKRAEELAAERDEALAAISAKLDYYIVRREHLTPQGG
jgi:DNA repair ATPase RecN